MDEKMSVSEKDIDADAFFKWSAIFSGTMLAFGIILFIIFPSLGASTATGESQCRVPAPQECVQEQSSLGLRYSEFTPECFCATVRTGLAYINVIIAIVFVSSACGWMFTKGGHRAHLRAAKAGA